MSGAEAEVRFFSSREGWLAARKQSLGASDVARVFTERVSEFALWAEKTGRAEPEFPPLLSEVGLALEPVSRRWAGRYFEALPGTLLARATWLDSEIMMARRADRLLSATPDTIFMVILAGAAGNESWLCQHKTIDRTQAWKIESGPEAYAWTQVQAELLCIPQCERAWVSYLVGNGYDAERDFRVFEVVPDPEFQARILAFAERFATCVNTDAPPEPGELDDVHAVLATMFPPRVPRRAGLLPAEHEPDVERWRQIELVMDQLEREKQGIRNRLEYAMSEAGLEEATVALDEDGGPTTQPARLLRTQRKDGVVVFQKKEPKG